LTSAFSALTNEGEDLSEREESLNPRLKLIDGS
jgi:hypothetical protein